MGNRFEMEREDYFEPVLAELRAALPAAEVSASYAAGMALGQEDAARLAIARLGALEVL